MKRVVVLVDGQNLYYSIKELRLIERDIAWDALFKSFLEPGDELVRTYWFRPQKIMDTWYTPAHIRHQIVNKDFRQYSQAYRQDKLSLPATVQEQIEARALEIEGWLKKEKERFANIEYQYDQLALEYEDIELVKTGVVKVNPFGQFYVGEKGVDIALAVKMIALSVEKKCDKIILVSGDFDYAEAVKYVKDNMTKIHLVKIHKGQPPKNRSVSHDLAVLADKVINIYQSELTTTFQSKFAQAK